MTLSLYRLSHLAIAHARLGQSAPVMCLPTPTEPEKNMNIGSHLSLNHAKGISVNETNSASETEQKASTDTTPGPIKSASLSSEQIEEELADIGAHTYVKRANVQKINYLMVILAFRAGYFFCMAMHKLVGITAQDQPTIATAQDAISQMKTHLGGK